MKKSAPITRPNLLAIIALIAVMALSGSPFAQSQEQVPSIEDKEVALTTTMENLPDRSPIVLTGIIGEVRNDGFDLSYGATSPITVELGRFNWVDNAADYLSTGERVTIRGFIDDSLFQGRKIEAYDLQLHQRSTYYRTSEGAQSDTYSINGVALEDGTYITVTGTVTEVQPAKLEMITSDGDKFTVDAKNLNPPLRRDDGSYFITPGERANISGHFNMRFYQNKTIFADRIIKLVDSGIAPIIAE